MKLIYIIHNKVNDKLCVPKCKRPAFKDVDNFYEQFRASGCNSDSFGCRKAGKNPSVIASINYEPRENNTKDYDTQITLQKITKEKLDIECITHILHDDNSKRRFEYYQQLSKKYKTKLKQLAKENKMKLHIENDELHIY